MTSDGAIYQAVSYGDMTPDEVSQLTAELGAMLNMVANWSAASGPLLDHEFDLGEEVEKYTGDYVWRGTVCSVFRTPAGKVRYVVAHPAGEGHVLHIYSEANLRRVA